MTADSVSDRTDRDEVLDRLTDVIDLAHTRIDRFDPDSPAEEELLIKWIRALASLSGQYRQLLNDRELDEMAAELERLSYDEDTATSDTGA
ncbi:hypothetical protein [Halovivax gelatinilyticus]|uniref:hypothetical protein n=1 Tax=Halovivax gelatinilyticus TaxID=2961597 RepID=UPI0020CA7A84|nr:hypothetical protein [Halovivax gelatinilyticus]